MTVKQLYTLWFEIWTILYKGDLLMQEIIVDEEFRLLLPTLDKVTFESLEKNILAHGVRDPLVVWNDILIDGYNRYKICTMHNLPFTTISMEFHSRDEAQNWIIENQISRRNLTPVELSHFRGLYFNAVKRIQGSNNQHTQKSEKPQSEVFHKGFNTAKEIGKKFNVSKTTIERDAKVAEALSAIAKISPEAKQKILSGEVPFDRNKLQRLSKAPKEEIEDVVRQINEGTYNRNDYRIKKTPEQTQTQQNYFAAFSQNEATENENIDSTVSQLINSINEKVNSLSQKNNMPEFKTSLRTFIDSLEEIYKSLEK